MTSTTLSTPIRNPFASLRNWIHRNVERIPLWKEFNLLCNVVAVPIKLVATACLLRFPWISRFEWILETGSLTTKSPVAIAIPVLIAIWRGYRTTPFGHIGTDRALYPFIAALSSFNPFLAVCCSLLFATADFVQKLMVNDMYGTGTRMDYWGAMLGYVASYSAVVTTALIPGIAARLCRRAVVYPVAKAWRADGAAKSRIRPHSVRTLPVWRALSPVAI